MMLDDKSFAGSERGAEVERVEEAVFTAHRANESQRRPEEAMMRAETPENNEAGGRIDVLDSHDAALGFQHGQTVNSVTFLHALPQRREQSVAMKERTGGGGRESRLLRTQGCVGIDDLAHEITLLATNHGRR